jgi:hypothetical protein
MLWMTSTMVHRCLRRCLDCYRVERTGSRAGLSPAVDQCFSRRTITLHWVAELIVFSTFNAALREYVQAPKKRLKDEIGERSDLGSMEKSGTSRDAIPSEPVVR